MSPTGNKGRVCEGFLESRFGISMYRLTVIALAVRLFAGFNVRSNEHFPKEGKIKGNQYNKKTLSAKNQTVEGQ